MGRYSSGHRGSDSEGRTDAHEIIVREVRAEEILPEIVAGKFPGAEGSPVPNSGNGEQD